MTPGSGGTRGTLAIVGSPAAWMLLLLRWTPVAVVCAQEPGSAPGGLFGERPLFEQVSKSVFRLGEIELDKEKRTVRFPARINMREEIVEYFCVTESGRIHEAILSTKVSPMRVHVAILLLGRPGEIVPPAHADRLGIQGGTPVNLSVRWTSGDGEKKVVRASDLILHIERGEPLAPDTWRYTSSRMREGAFLAELDGTIAAIMGDGNALLNIGDEDRDNDEVWKANAALLPPVGTAVEVVIELPAEGNEDGGSAEQQED